MPWDSGKVRVAEKFDGKWEVRQWCKKAVLLSFRLNDSAPIPGAPGNAAWFDKVPSKFDNWGQAEFAAAGFRAVPGAVVRHSAFIAKGAVLMPSFVNVGAYVGENTMVDTWATVGSCAQIGANCHLSGGVGIGGVLEPLQAEPVIVEDNCFIGARSEVAEGVIVHEGAVLSMGVFIGASTKVYDRQTARCTSARCRPMRSSCRARCRARRTSRACIAPSSSRRWTSRRGPRPPSTNCCATSRWGRGRLSWPMQPIRSPCCRR